MRFQGIYVFQLAKNGGQHTITAMELFIIILIFFIGVQLLHNDVLCSLYSQVNQLYVYICPLFQISFQFRSPQSTVEAFLCYRQGSH